MSAVADAVTWWTQLYASHDVVQLAAAGGHLMAIAYAARFALRGDRAALRLTSGAALSSSASSGSAVHRASARSSHSPIGDITTITRAHRHVITGLCFAVITGIAQLVARLDYLPQSPIFWTKMFMLVLLLANGRVVQLTGRRVAQTMASQPNAPPPQSSMPHANASRSLRSAAIRSITFWVAMVVLGLLLTTVRPG